MVMGRPREHDREQIKIEMIEWARLPDSINFNKFCCTREPPMAASSLLKWAKESDDFRATYEIAKAFLGARREEWLSSEQLHVKAYDLNVNVYDLIAKEEKKENSTFELSLRKQENIEPQDNQKDLMASMMNLLISMQQDNQALRSSVDKNV